MLLPIYYQSRMRCSRRSFNRQWNPLWRGVASPSLHCS